jgi:hypothetical protein
LDESFGELITDEKLSYADISKYLVLTAVEDPLNIREINEYMEEAHEQSGV